MTVRGPSGTALKLSLGRLRAASPERGALRTPPTEAELERSAVSGEGDRSRRPAPASLDQGRQLPLCGSRKGAGEGKQVSESQKISHAAQGGPIGDEPIRPPRWEQSAEASPCAPAATAPSAWLKTFQRAAVRRLRRTGRGGSFSVGSADPDGGIPGPSSKKRPLCREWGRRGVPVGGTLRQWAFPAARALRRGPQRGGSAGKPFLKNAALQNARRKYL